MLTRIPLPALPDAPLRATDVHLQTRHGEVIARATRARLARASPGYLGPRLRGTERVLTVGPPGLHPGVARNLVVWSTHLDTRAQKSAWIAAMLPLRRPWWLDAEDEWPLLLAYLSAARALQLDEMERWLHAAVLRPALRALALSPRERLQWRKSLPCAVEGFHALSLDQQTAFCALPEVPGCARLPALGLDVRDAPDQGLYIERVHQPASGSPPPAVRRGMRLWMVGSEDIRQGATLPEKVASVRRALQLEAPPDAQGNRQPVRLHVLQCAYTDGAWLPWPPVLLEVHRQLQSLRLPDALALLGAAVREWREDAARLPAELGLPRAGRRAAARALRGLDAADPLLRLLCSSRRRGVKRKR